MSETPPEIKDKLVLDDATRKPRFVIDPIATGDGSNGIWGYTLLPLKIENPSTVADLELPAPLATLTASPKPQTKTLVLLDASRNPVSTIEVIDARYSLARGGMVIYIQAAGPDAQSHPTYKIVPVGSEPEEITVPEYDDYAFNMVSLDEYDTAVGLSELINQPDRPRVYFDPAVAAYRQANDTPTPVSVGGDD